MALVALSVGSIRRNETREQTVNVFYIHFFSSSQLPRRIVFVDHSRTKDKLDVISVAAPNHQAIQMLKSESE